MPVLPLDRPMDLGKGYSGRMRDSVLESRLRRHRAGQLEGDSSRRGFMERRSEAGRACKMITSDLCRIMRLWDDTYLKFDGRHLFWKASAEDGGIWRREHIDRWLERFGAPVQRHDVALIPAGCHCCGELAWSNGRCTKHQGRNPCALEGCGRTTKVPNNGGLSSDGWICSEHWRRYVPPRSRERRLYHRHFRRAKRLGWSPERRRAFRVYWFRLVARVRERAAGGFLDETEINRMFGLGEPGG